MNLKIPLKKIWSAVPYLMLAWSPALFSQVTVQTQNKTIKETLGEIESRSQYKFFYNNDLKNLDQYASLNEKDKSIEEVLTNLLAKSDIGWKEQENNIILLIQNENNIHASQQNDNIKISGTVKDANGEEIIGASVRVKGMTTGTVTNYDGEFSLSVPSNSTLIISYMGFITQEVPVKDQDIFNIILKEDDKSLDEVVVTALGIKRSEKALGYAVQQVNTDELTTVKGANVATSLSGKIAGVMVKNHTDFGKETDFYVRGVKPLLVIDGIPVPNMQLSEIPADDIESISVLKGATASALYGSDGGNGAVMITLKNGTSSGYKISVNTSNMFSAGYLAIPKQQAVFGRGMTGVYDKNADRVWGQVMDGTEIVQWNPITKRDELQPYLPVGKNNFQHFVNPGIVSNSNVSIENGSANNHLRASGTFIYNKGQYPNNWMNQINFGLSGKMKVDAFELSGSLSYNKYHSPNQGFNGYKNYDPMYSLLIWSGADYDIRQYKNNYWLIPGVYQNSSYDPVSNIDNAYFSQYGRTNSVDRNVVNATLNMTYYLTPWMRAMVRSGINFRSNRQETKVNQGGFTGTGSSYWGQDKLKGMYASRETTMWDTTSDAMLLADKGVGNFMFEGLLGTSAYYYRNDYLLGRTEGGISLPEFFSLQASVLNAVTSSSAKAKRKNGLYGKFGTAYKSLAFLEATFRNDWSSTLSKGNRSFFYPSVAGSFVLSELIKPMEEMDFWKIRGSWTVSKREPAIFENNVAYSVSANQWGSMSGASLPTSLMPDNLKPMAQTTFEVGTMISFFSGRLNFDFAYYTIEEKNRIISTSISPASGYTSAKVNTKENIMRKGFELTLKGTIVDTKDLTWNVGTNWTRYADYYSSIDPEYSAERDWVKKGKRSDAYVIQNFEYSPDGQYVFTDQGVHKYSTVSTVYGYSNPDWIWGIDTQLKYKRVTFGVSVDGRIGGLTPSITETYLWQSGNHPKSVTEARYNDVANALNPVPGYNGTFIGKGVKIVSGEIKYDPSGNIISDTRVFAPNDITTPYRNYVASAHRSFVWGGDPSPLDVYSTTFFKLREISVTYDIPKNIISKANIKHASISAVGQNVLLWSKDFKYSDPDGGEDNFVSPSARFMGVNLKVEF